MAAAQAVKLWESALQQLDKLPATKPDPKQLVDVSYGHLPSACTFLELPKVNASVFNKLVALKVPQQLGQAAASAPTSPLAPKSFAATCALGFLIQKAVLEEALTHDTTGSSPKGIPSKLSKEIGLQLKQSGFFAALPKLLAAVADALTDTQADPAWADIPLQVKVLPASDSARQLAYLQESATWLLLLTKESLCFFPQQLDRAAVAVPALRLCAAVLQLCSRCADRIPAEGAEAAAPPTSLEQLMLAAFAAGQAVIAAWDLNEGDFDPALSSSADALRAISMLLLVPTICPEDYNQSTPQIPDSSAARSKPAKIRLTQRANTSAAAWQFACAHEAELPAVQQAALRELGCSGRAFMYAAGHILMPAMTPLVVMQLCQALYTVAKHSITHTEALSEKLESGLSHAQQLSLAESLSRADPPSSTPLLPCAPLFWLLPAVVLQWADKQPAAGGLGFSRQQYSLMLLLHVSVSGVLEQQRYWEAADHAMYEAAGGAEAAFEEQQALANAMLAMISQGAAIAPTIPASMRGLSPQEPARANPERKLFKEAGKTAAAFSSDCAPPASCIAQLLQLASNAAGRLLASIQDAAAAGDGSAGGSSSTGPSTGSSSSTRGTSSGPDLSDSEAEQLDSAMWQLASTLSPLLQLAKGCLWNVFCHDRAAVKYDPLKRLEAMGAVGVGRPPRRSTSHWDGSSGNSDSESDEDISSSSTAGQQQEGLADLCAALQETLPQLTALLEAALRRWVGRKPYSGLAAVGNNFLRGLTADSVFLAAGVGQPGSSVLKPLASLTFTLLKLVSEVHNQPDVPVGYRDLTIESGTLCLETVLQANSLILRAACCTTNSSASSSSRSSGGSSGGSAAAAVAGMLARSSGQKGSGLDPRQLFAISTGAGTSTSTPATGSNSSSSSTDAVSMMPWLVTLGRSCLLYSLVLTDSYAKAAAGPGKSAGHKAKDAVAAMARAFQAVSAVLPGWLQSSTVAGQLAAAGYVTDTVVELLQSACTAQQHVAQAGPDVLAQLLQGLGLALSSMPVGLACNNPLCTTLTGLSEQQLVVGSSRRCSGCRVARYCCKSCQIMKWKQHKPACKAAAAAAAAAKAAAA